VPRIIVEQKNLWGKAGGKVEPQRADLWQLGLVSVVNGINSFAYEDGALDVVPEIPAYFASSVTLPELRVKAEVYRRDSRSYQMPSWDDPLDAIRVVFLLDAGSDAKASAIYRVLDAWRALVRAGRGSVSNGYSTQNMTGAPGSRFVALNSDYRSDYAFNIPVTLLKGAVPKVNSTRSAQEAAFSNVGVAQKTSSNFFNAQQRINEALKLTGSAADAARSDAATQRALDSQRAASRSSVFNNTFTANSAGDDTVNNDLQVAGAYLLTNAWLAGFKVSELSYTSNALVTVEATLYAEDIVDTVDDSSAGLGEGIIGDFPAGFGAANANLA